MVQETWELQKYVTETGICPFDEWFDTLDSTTKARIDVRFDRVITGNFGDYKSVGEGIYELRFFFGSGYRVYYAISGKRIILLLIAGSKKSQNKDIKMAQRFWTNYKRETRGV